MEIIVDTENITEAGFDVYLDRNLFIGENSSVSMTLRTTTDANSITGGIIGSEGILYLGSKQIRIDGKNRNIVTRDGINDRVLIGDF